MGERNRWRVYKGPDKRTFRSAIEDVLRNRQGKVYWDESPTGSDDYLTLSHSGDVHTLVVPYLGGRDYLFSAAIGSLLDIPWIELRIQDGTLWDYSLFHGRTHLHTFSTLPEYWDDDHEWQATQRGSPIELATAWHIDQGRIEKYLKPWRMEASDEGLTFGLQGKAYAMDQSAYGDIWQSVDFLKALGGSDPLEHGESHRVQFPTVESFKSIP